MTRGFEKFLMDRERKQESLLEVPDQLKSAIQRLDGIAHTLSETLSGFEPARYCDIFLSHKSIDKVVVLRIKNVLDAAGFQPWIDQERMPAGTTLDRAILDGIKGSCAAVFFITPNFEDNRFLSQEIDYAIQVQRERPDTFAIIPILIDNAADSDVPDLLRRFVIKRAITEIDILLHIFQALPIRLGPPIKDH
jgi:hypothetical protein